MYEIIYQAQREYISGPINKQFLAWIGDYDRQTLEEAQADLVKIRERVSGNQFSTGKFRIVEIERQTIENVIAIYEG
jgi:hypothetical protein